MTVKPDSPIAKKYVVSPNHDARESRIDILLLHYTGMQTADEALARLADRGAKVSCHYFVDEDGRVTQMVPEARRAWHGGLGSWKGAVDINSRSIGIEIVNPGHELGYRDFPDAQIDAVIALCRDIIKRRHIARERVLAHSDVAPARKKDPGEKFPWAKLAAAGVGLWVEPAPIAEGRTLSANDRGVPVEDLQKQLIKLGYGLEVSRSYDDATRLVVTAFQRHFRPERVDGLADPSTMETLRSLLRALRAHH
ncbi:MAG: N-acetylmuramoyl-L-alanine amidase [Xanthobacteraceae bacterium]